MPKILNKKLFIQAKAAGLNNTDAAMAAGAKNRATAKQSGYNLSKNPEIILDLEFELSKADLNVRLPLQRIREALDAEKVVITGKGDDAFADVQPDHAVRLKAANMVLDLIGAKHRPDMSTIAKLPSKELKEALSNGDEIELQRIVFNKSDK